MSADWLAGIERALSKGAYNCTCQVGGVDAMSIDTDWLRAATSAIRTERDALAARLAAVEALADEWEQRCEHYRGTGNYHAQRSVTNELRAALATGATTNQQEGTDD